MEASSNWRIPERYVSLNLAGRSSQEQQWPSGRKQKKKEVREILPPHTLHPSSCPQGSPPEHTADLQMTDSVTSLGQKMLHATAQKGGQEGAKCISQHRPGQKHRTVSIRNLSSIWSQSRGVSWLCHRQDM